jgi:GNAT superfamily N-acetyltransferase
MDKERIEKRNSSIKIIPYAPEYNEQMGLIAEGMHRDSIYSDMPLDKAKVIRQLAACGNLAPDRWFRLAVRFGEVLGGFYGHSRKTFFCDEILAHDLGWWVKPNARGSAAAVMLLFEFERWAKTQGAKKLMVGQSTALDIERTTKFYKHCGFRVIGFNTVKDI